MRNAGLEETQAGIKIAERNINNLRYADDTTLMAESEEELKNLLVKVEKTTRPFRYDLNQIPYDYTVEERNRFKVLDLIECLMNYGWSFMTLYRRQGLRPSPRNRNAKKQNGCLKRPYK